MSETARSGFIAANATPDNEGILCEWSLRSPSLIRHPTYIWASVNK